MEARELVDHLVAAFNAYDVDAFANLFVDDAEFVNIFGMRMRGRAGIKAGHAHAFAVVLKGTTLHSVNVDHRAVGDDAALMHLEWQRDRNADATASSLPPGAGIMTLIAHRTSGGWKLVGGTNVAITAQPGGPPPAR